MKNISELTDQEIIILAEMWEERVKTIKNIYFVRLFRDKVKEGIMPIEELPFYIVQRLIEWGYDIKSYGIKITERCHTGSELTEEQIESLAAIWAEKLYAPPKTEIAAFFRDKVREGKIPIDELPLFIVEILIEWGIVKINNQILK